MCVCVCMYVHVMCVWVWVCVSEGCFVAGCQEGGVVKASGVERVN